MDKKITQQPGKPDKAKSKQSDRKQNAPPDDEQTDEQLRTVSGGHHGETVPT
jgi:hypothetical protein